MYQKNWENLANAIVEKAADDYRNVLKNLKLDPFSPMALRDRKEIESFFTSGWFAHLTRVDGKWLMERIQMEVR